VLSFVFEGASAKRKAIWPSIKTRLGRLNIRSGATS
jgi:hypothetical protein